MVAGGDFLGSGLFLKGFLDNLREKVGEGDFEVDDIIIVIDGIDKFFHGLIVSDIGDEFELDFVVVWKFLEIEVFHRVGNLGESVGVLLMFDCIWH